MGNPEAEPGIAVRFLSSVINDHPESLERLTPRNRYILFAHSATEDRRGFKELGEIFGIKEETTLRTYRNTLGEVFQSSSQEIQQAYPLRNILDSVSDRGVNQDLFIDEVDMDLWKYVQDNNIKGELRKYLSEDELAKLEKYFELKKRPEGLGDLLDKFSLAIANLA